MFSPRMIKENNYASEKDRRRGERKRGEEREREIAREKERERKRERERERERERDRDREMGDLREDVPEVSTDVNAIRIEVSKGAGS